MLQFLISIESHNDKNYDDQGKQVSVAVGKIFTNAASYLFTESSLVLLVQRQDPCERRSLPLENECHLLPFPHNWMRCPAAKPRE